MATLDPVDFALHLAFDSEQARLDEDEEWCEIETDGKRRRIRFHDYASIYEIPGLYERLFAEQLECDSPRVVVDLLGEHLRAAKVKPADLTALDFGAGNGMVGERLAEISIGEIVGVDLLPEARDAAHRDRPGLYREYYALDLTDLASGPRRDLTRHDFSVMACVAALGFGDIPPLAFAEALNLVASPGWVAFNIRDRFLEEEWGFGGFIARMLHEGVLVERARKLYTHRQSVSGESLEYVAMVAEKHYDVPLAWARDASAGLDPKRRLREASKALFGNSYRLELFIAIGATDRGFYARELAARMGVADNLVTTQLRRLVDLGLLKKRLSGAHVIYERAPSAIWTLASEVGVEFDDT